MTIKGVRDRSGGLVLDPVSDYDRITTYVFDYPR